MMSWLPDWLTRALRVAEENPTAWPLVTATSQTATAASAQVALLPLPRPRDPRDEAWLDLLLCPSRTGFAVTTLDVVRIGRELSVAIERVSPRDGLRTLIARHPAGTLRRLAHTAEAEAEAHERRATLEHDPEWWAARARQTAQLLREQAALFGTQLSVVGAGVTRSVSSR
jgi:hypothetical protein